MAVSQKSSHLDRKCTSMTSSTSRVYAVLSAIGLSHEKAAAANAHVIHPHSAICKLLYTSAKPVSDSLGADEERSHNSSTTAR